MINAMIIDEKRQRCCRHRTGKEGGYRLRTWIRTRKPFLFTAVEDIQIYHKNRYHIKDIPADAPIVKYGEHIGHAARDIKQGEHVHEHNVKSVRENLG